MSFKEASWAVARRLLVASGITNDTGYPIYTTLALTYVISSLVYKNPNPLDWQKIERQRAQQTAQLDNTLFGEHGLADRNGDGNISPLERAEAYTLAGRELTDSPLTPAEMQKAIANYKLQQAQSTTQSGR